MGSGKFTFLVNAAESERRRGQRSSYVKWERKSSTVGKSAKRLYSAMATKLEANGDVSPLHVSDQWGKKAGCSEYRSVHTVQRTELNALRPIAAPIAPPIVGACGGVEGHVEGGMPGRFLSSTDTLEHCELRSGPDDRCSLFQFQW